MCVIYYEDTCTKTNDGDLNQKKVDRKVVWVYPNEINPSRCPVRLLEKYLSLCPKYEKKTNLYLKSLTKPTPKVWYKSQVVGSNTLGKVVKGLLHDARIDRYFTGHSLRHTGMTRLCQAGVQKKLVKEISGHRSDAIDAYQVTSHEQKKQISHILANKPSTITCQEFDTLPIDVNNDQSVQKDKASPVIGDHVTQNASQVSVKTDEVTRSTVIRSQNIGSMINDIIEKNDKKGKTIIKIEIEITHE